MDKNQTKLRHACTYDARIDLDRGPEGREEIIPGWVLAVGEFEEGLKTDDADYRDAR